MTRRRVDVEVTATDRTRAGLASVRHGLDNLNTTVRRLGEQTTHVDRLVRVLRSNYLSFLAIRMAFSGLGELAKTRIETQRLLFTFQAASGSAQEAARSFAFVHKTAVKMGLDFVQAADGLAYMEAAARGANVPLKEAKTLWLAVSKATVLYHLSTDRVKRVFYALIEMMSEGRIQARQLRRQLSTALPIGIIGRFAAAIGVTVAQLNKMMKAGQLTARKYLPMLAQAISGAVPKKELIRASTDSFLANLNRAKTALFDFQQVVNKGGYISVVTNGLKGFTAAVDFLKINLLSISQVLKIAFLSISTVIGVRFVQALLSAEFRANKLVSVMAELKAVMALLGGPVGIIALVVVALGSFVYFATKSSTEARILGGNIRGLTGDLKDLTSAQLQESIVQLQAKLAKLQPKAIAQYEQKVIKQIPLAYSDAGTASRVRSQMQSIADEQIKKVTASIARYRARLAQLNKKPLRIVPPVLPEMNKGHGTGTISNLNAQAASVIASIQTPLQKYNATIAKLQTLLSAGKLSQEQFNLAVRRATVALGNARAGAKTAGHEMSQYAIQAARSMETSFANFLFDPFAGGLKGMVRGFADAMRRIMANAAAAHIAHSLFGGMGSAIGGGAASGLISKGVATGVNLVKFFLLHQGGIAGTGGIPGLAPAALFANAPRLHTGGTLGVGEIPAILRRGEEVITQDDPRHQARGGIPSVQIIMNVQTTDVGSFRRSEQQLGQRLGESIRRAMGRS